MKNLLKANLLFSLVLIFSCSGNKNSATSEISDDSGFAVCIWDRASLKESPDAKGKWIESLSLGEKCEYLDDTKDDNSGSKPVQYYKVKLADGKEGWVQASLMSLKSKPAAINQDAEVYSRPDLLTKSDKMFSKMDIVAVTATSGDFIEVKGKRKDGKWIETGWIKSANVTYSDVDIAVAKFARKALSLNDEAKKQKAIGDILANRDFSTSIFISELSKYTEVAEQEEIENISDSTVNSDETGEYND